MIKSVAAVIFNVSDLDKACDFYEKQLGMTLSYKNSKTSWAEFNLNGVKFSLTKAAPFGKSDNPTVSLYVDSLERSVDEFRNNGVIFSDGGDIKIEFYGKHIQMEDPDGNKIILFERPA